MCLSQSNQTFQHSDCFTIFGQCLSASQILIVALNNHFCKFITHRLNVALDKNNVLGQFIGAPYGLILVIVIFLLASEGQFEIRAC